MHIVKAQHISYAVIAFLAASFIFSCESRYGESSSDNGARHKQKVTSRRENSRKKKNDAAFVILAANDLQLESQLAQLAVGQAASTEVKEFAVSVMTDHSIAMDELREIAFRNDITLPQQLSPDERKDLARIAKRRGLQFDRAFCDFIYLNNTATLKKFEEIAQDSNSEVLGKWASEKLDVMKRHIATARKY